MRNIVHGHWAITLRIKNKGIHHVLDVTQHLGIILVKNLHAVDGEVVHVQVRFQVSQSDAPRVVPSVSHQRVHARIDDQAHGVGASRLDFERHGSVLGNVRTVDGVKVSLRSCNKCHQCK
jgi:hypothetical protein